MNNWLFRSAEFLSSPPGFYLMLAAMGISTMLVLIGWTDMVTYFLSVLAIIITGIVLIQGYRDTAALHAKLDEILLALRETRNDLVGLEHEDPQKISAVIAELEDRAKQLSEAPTGG